MALSELEGGNVETAAVLAGAAGSAREKLGGGWSPAAVGLQRAGEALETRLGPEAAEEAMAPGRLLSLEDAVRLAVEGPDPRSLSGEPRPTDAP